MPQNKQLRRWVIAGLIVGISVIGGFYAGMWVSSIGVDSEGGALIARGAVFICPMVAIALILDFRWVFAMVAYGVGFYQGYTAFDGLGDSIGSIIHGVTSIIALPSAWLSGGNLPAYQPQTRSGLQAHPELLWYFDLALLFVSVAAILRHERRLINNAQQAVGGNRR